MWKNPTKLFGQLICPAIRWIHMKLGNKIKAVAIFSALLVLRSMAGGEWTFVTVLKGSGSNPIINFRWDIVMVQRAEEVSEASSFVVWRGTKRASDIPVRVPFPTCSSAPCQVHLGKCPPSRMEPVFAVPIWELAFLGQAFFSRAIQFSQNITKILFHNKNNNPQISLSMLNLNLSNFFFYVLASVIGPPYSPLIC